jgi:hypothetical protein
MASVFRNLDVHSSLLIIARNIPYYLCPCLPVSRAFINRVNILLSTKVSVSQEVNVLTAAKESFFERLLHCKTYAELSKDEPVLLVLDIHAISITSYRISHYCRDNGVMNVSVLTPTARPRHS